MNYKDYTVNELLKYLGNIPKELRGILKITIVTEDREDETRKIPETSHSVKDSNIDKEIKLYIDYIYQHHKEGVCPGYMKISKNIGLTLDNCRKIKSYLEKLQIVKTTGTETFILDTQEICNKKIGGVV